MQSSITRRGASVLIITFVSAYVYVFLEWLFFLTKPSFLSSSTFSSALVSLGLAPLSLVIPGLLIVSVIFGMIFLLYRLSKSALVINLGAWLALLLLPTSIVAITILLLIDNFTYTMFGFGIVHSENSLVWLYTIGITIIALLTFRWLIKLEHNVTILSQVAFIRLFIATSGILVISLSCLLFVDRQGMVWSKYLADTAIEPDAIDKPNILIYFSDGLNAEHLSAYGHERKTTPFIDRFIKEKNVLFFENAFPNTSHTGGSIMSLLTGKQTFTVRVMQAPQILRGKDSLEHFPGILKNLGYRSLFIGMRNYADPYDANMLDSFDVANGRSAPDSEYFTRLKTMLGQTTAYFLGALFNRVKERLLHIFHVRPMPDLYAIVTKGTHQAPGQGSVHEKLIEFTGQSAQPFFAFAHHMGTHGPKYFAFSPDAKERFSKDSRQVKDFDLDFYDESIRGYDYRLQQVVEHLEKTGKLDNTIIVIGSDHGFRWNDLQRVPLIMYFPDGQHGGRTNINVQNLDIAPTILNYLRLPIPQWMEGRSILYPDKLEEIPIIGARRMGFVDLTNEEQRNTLYERAPISGKIPPYYLFGRMNAIYCDTALVYSMRYNTVIRRRILGHTGACDPAIVPSDNKYKKFVKQRLISTGFDVTFMDEEGSAFSTTVSNAVTRPAPVTESKPATDRGSIRSVSDSALASKIISPDPTTAPLLTSDTVTFSWSDAGNRATAYGMWISTVASGHSEFYKSGDQVNFPALTTSVTISGLPRTGVPVYVRLWTHMVCPAEEHGCTDGWHYRDYTYTTASS